MSIAPSDTNIISRLIDTLAPPRCMNCLQEGTWLCDKCYRQFKKVPLICVHCEKQKPTGRTCSKCKNKTNLTGLISAGSYESQLLRRGIHWLKFKSIKDVAPILATFMMMRLNIISPISQLPQNSALVPVPLHPKRQSSRGFNQSMELCRAINNTLNIPIYDIVSREKSTLTQSNLPPELRTNNVANAFTLKTFPPDKGGEGGYNVTSTYPPQPKNLIIVDDVTTSGSTLNAVAKPLQKINPKAIWGLTIARG